MTADRERTVLVLGAHGGAGREVVRQLVDTPDATIVAAGRRAERLRALVSTLPPGRVVPQVVDVADGAALAGACSGAAIVVNCVGPYLERGAAIAEAAIDGGASYVDVASEQEHYVRLQGLDGEARARGCFLLTGAGLIPGLSALLAVHGANRLGEPDEIEAIEMVFAQHRVPDAGAGLGSLMSGVLDAGFRPLGLRDGELAPVRLGAQRRRVTLPPPFGETNVIGFPSLETLTLAERFAVRTIESWYLLADVPPAFLRLIDVLQPHRRPWAYRLLRGAAAWGMRRAHARSVAAGVGTEAVLRVTVRDAEEAWETTAVLPAGGFVPTAYLPVLAARRRLAGRFDHRGVITPVDVFEPEEVLADLASRGRPLDLTERRSA
jgi:hypothetical protein